MKKPITSLLGEIKTLASTGARFISLIYTAKGTGEVARHTLAVGVSIENAYWRDVAILTAKRPTLAGLALQACDELLASLRESLEKGVGNNSAYTCKGVYEPIARGLKLQVETGVLHVTGFSIGKEVIAPGVYRDVKSKPLTVEKDKLRKGLKSGKFRQYAVSELETVAMNGKRLVFA